MRPSTSEANYRLPEARHAGVGTYMSSALRSPALESANLRSVDWFYSLLSSKPDAGVSKARHMEDDGCSWPRVHSPRGFGFRKYYRPHHLPIQQVHMKRHLDLSGLVLSTTPDVDDRLICDQAPARFSFECGMSGEFWISLELSRGTEQSHSTTWGNRFQDFNTLMFYSLFRRCGT